MHFHDIIKWFRQSDFEYLMLFLPSCDTKDRKYDNFIIENQYSIDHLTGDKIAYITYDTVSIKDSLVRVKERPMSRDAIRTHICISEEVCNCLNIGQYNLPSLILISKKLKYTLYPLKTEADLDSYFTPIGIITSFTTDYCHVKSMKNQYLSLERDKSRLIQERSSTEEEKIFWEKSLRENKRDETLAIRIDTNYRLLFNYLKKKKVKQNVFEKAFSYLDENSVVKELDRLGLNENMHCHVKEIVEDLKKVKNFSKFQAQYGCVTSQMERLINLYPIVIKEKEERINELTNEIIDIEKRLPIDPKKLKEYDDELATILSIYGMKLNNSVFVTNGEDILSDVCKNYSSGLMQLLDRVKEKAGKINIIIERLNKRVEEEGFDVFISCKSQDYKKAYEVYNYLYDNGHKPFLADPVLREIGTDYYGYLIRRIVNKCSFMIVYATNIDYMNTSYVHQEWNQFLDELSSGLKEGKLFSIISPSISAQMLPSGLSTRQFFTFENYKESLLEYLKLDRKHSFACPRESNEDVRGKKSFLERLFRKKS